MVILGVGLTRSGSEDDPPSGLISMVWGGEADEATRCHPIEFTLSRHIRLPGGSAKEENHTSKRFIFMIVFHFYNKFWENKLILDMYHRLGH